MARTIHTEANTSEIELKTGEKANPVSAEPSKLETVFKTNRAEILGVMSGKYKSVPATLFLALLDCVEIPQDFRTALEMFQEAESYQRANVGGRKKKTEGAPLA